MYIWEPVKGSFLLSIKSMLDNIGNIC
jgi:hypothetical protein